MSLATLRARKFLRATMSPLGRRAFRLGVVASEEHRCVLANQRAIAHVLDVGANRGQFSLLVRDLFPMARIEAWEPLNEAYATYSSIFGDDGDVIVHNVALSDRAGEEDLHVTRASDSSSFLVPISDAPSLQVDEVRRVGTRRLDDYSPERLADHRVLLKLDVQGGELAVLRGAPETLQHVDVVLIELGVGSRYRDHPRPVALMAVLEEAGLAPVSFHDLHRFPDGAQVDMLWVRSRRGTA